MTGPRGSPPSVPAASAWGKVRKDSGAVSLPAGQCSPPESVSMHVYTACPLALNTVGSIQDFTPRQQSKQRAAPRSTVSRPGPCPTEGLLLGARSTGPAGRQLYKDAMLAENVGKAPSSQSHVPRGQAGFPAGSRQDRLWLCCHRGTDFSSPWI